MIHIFKTSVKTKKAMKQLSPYLNEIVASKWNFDLADCDNILRINASTALANLAIKCLKDNGFVCEELED